MFCYTGSWLPGMFQYQVWQWSSGVHIQTHGRLPQRRPGNTSSIKKKNGNY